ncbi:hypothetical protein BS47DRAFT_1355799 [Hydnum rufescens UP504]|uniref:Uncharacterized protein n=1 Tax=Hydnum rufescens UP504 TaxID=1448309 RepID=A0A9P6AEJ3_9AGAM|nr:hypothetical protein BS47DRAFT_1355799 [Hydnum rufescens UP504]
MALGFPEHYVFGAAQGDAGVITTHAATWSHNHNKVLIYNLETYSLDVPDQAASLFLFIRGVAKKAVEYKAELAKKQKKTLPPFAPEYQGWKAPPRVPSDRDTRKKRKRDADDNWFLSAWQSRDFMQDKRLWSGEMTQWAQEAVESLARSGSTGEPLRAESVRSLTYVDFLPV